MRPCNPSTKTTNHIRTRHPRRSDEVVPPTIDTPEERAQKKAARTKRAQRPQRLSILKRLDKWYPSP